MAHLCQLHYRNDQMQFSGTSGSCFLPIQIFEFQIPSVHVLITHTLTQVLLIEIFLQKHTSESLDESVSTVAVFRCVNNNKCTLYLFGLDHLLDILQFFLKLSLLFPRECWFSSKSGMKRKKRTHTLSKMLKLFHTIKVYGLQGHALE